MNIPIAIAQLIASLVAPSRQITLSWNPGGYSQFLIVTSDSITRPLQSWDWFAVVNGTNFTTIPDRPQRFFAVVGVDACGHWDYCGATN
jgi:hypothetical protein